MEFILPLLAVLVVLCGGCLGLAVLWLLFMLFGSVTPPQQTEPRVPMRDEEFIRLCGPDTPAETALKVRAIIARSIGWDPRYLQPDDVITDLCYEPKCVPIDS